MFRVSAPGVDVRIAGHHSEPGDPELLAWIQHTIDDLIGLGPAAAVGVLGLVIVAIPLTVLIAFLLRRPRRRETEE